MATHLSLSAGPHTASLRLHGVMSMARTRATPFDLQAFLARTGDGRTTLTATKKQILFSQGDAAGAVFYIQAGQVKLTVVSQEGKEAVVAMLECGAFLGESCLAGQTVRTATATAVKDSRLMRIDKEVMIHMLHEEPTFSELFQTHLLSRNLRLQDDLIDQLFNSAEKRLARTLLLLAYSESEGSKASVMPKIS